jgi:peptidoglycan/xylan/chitin deacetylase (PgdA/CDA1 family)/folate-dependent phosphoribosylglycinamide formyltransferase PurN
VAAVVALISKEWPGLFLGHELALAGIGLSDILVEDEPLDAVAKNVKGIGAVISSCGLSPTLQALMGFRHGIRHWRERRRNLRSAPVLADIERTGIRIHRVKRFVSDECETLLCALRPDTMVICGTPVLPASLLRTAAYGAVNIHTSVLPHYRGSGSLFWPLFFKDTDAIGYTIHQVAPQVDAGPSFWQERIEYQSGDTPETLLRKAFTRAVPKLVDILRVWPKPLENLTPYAKPVPFSWPRPTPEVRAYLNGPTLAATLKTPIRKLLYTARPLNPTRGSGIGFLCLHRVLGADTSPGDWRRVLGYPDVNQVREKLGYVRQSGELIPMADALKLLGSKRSIRGRFWVVTVDDGYRDFRTHLLPLLEELQVPAAFFVCSSAIETGNVWFHRLYQLIEGIAQDRLDIPFAGRHVWFGDVRHRVLTIERVLARHFKRLTHAEAQRRLKALLDANPVEAGPRSVDGFCSIDDLQALKRSSLVELHLHSHFHHPFERLSSEEATQDLERCTAFFREALSMQSSVLAYPNGECREDLVPTLQRAGVRYALTTRLGVERGDSLQPYFLRRIGLDNGPMDVWHRQMRRVFA